MRKADLDKIDRHVKWLISKLQMTAIEKHFERDKWNKMLERIKEQS